MKYIVSINTGDEYWDNDPEIVECNSVEEVTEELGVNFSEEEIRRLNAGEIISDENDVEFEVWMAK